MRVRSGCEPPDDKQDRNPNGEMQEARRYTARGSPDATKDSRRVVASTPPDNAGL